MDVHESPVTCTAYFADCPPDVIPVLYSIGAKHKKTGYSHKVTEFNYFYSIRYCWHCMINPLRPLRSAIPYGTCAVTVWTPHNVYVIRLWILSFMPCFCTYTMILKIGPLRFPWHLGSGTKKKGQIATNDIQCLYSKQKHFVFGLKWANWKVLVPIILEMMPALWWPNSDGFIDRHSTAKCRWMCWTCVGRHCTITHSLSGDCFVPQCLCWGVMIWTCVLIF